uniref:Helicase-associated domain-containing protein n=1 Tax=Amphora coffeiformis TaxID=265554 RepID=A0A7S3LBA9_9STRA|mmetsp:Transcript_4523/g.9110  ORF Transcript_4523/g.9110 Transcript_4523/m.9110 type:complete len:177 (-) Transcript_4523:101-631(-)
MPSEVFELTPQQLDWLYEHQTLKNVDGLQHHDLLLNPAALANTSPLSTPKPHSRLLDLRRASTGNDSCTASETTHNSNTDPSRDSPELISEGILFPFTGERPTWEQSLANLVCYKHRHGHCNVPRFYPTYRQLGSWVHRQRLKKKFPNKYGALKKEQIQQLETIGFTWRVRKENTP